MEAKRWAVYESGRDGRVHIAPTYGAAHTLTVYCWCRPCSKWTGGGHYYLHRDAISVAFDLDHNLLSFPIPAEE